jgi:malate permease and related proteins
LPALIFLYIPKLKFKDISFLPMLWPWLSFFLGYFLFKNIKSIPESTKNCLILCASLGNTSFLGLPMVDFFYGKQGLPYAIIADQLGTFLVLSVLGIPFLLSKSGETLSRNHFLMKILSFPPFLSLVFSSFFLSTNNPPLLQNVLQRLGDTLVPLAMVSVGFNWKWNHSPKVWKVLSIGLSYKLIVLPFFSFIFFYVLLQREDLIASVSILEMGMPPMITASILAIEKNQDPELASSLVAIGLLASCLTLPFWWYIMKSY